MQQSGIHEQLRALFDERDAIYVEKGVLRVRVANVRVNERAQTFRAEIEEIPTRGLVNVYGRQRWEVGDERDGLFFSDHFLAGFGWRIFTDPDVIIAIVDIASKWPHDLRYADRYNEVVRWLEDHDAVPRPARRVFSR